MTQSRHHMAEVIGEKTMHISDTKQLAGEIAAYLMAEKQTHQLQSLIRDIIQYRSDHGIVEATAVSVSPLPAEVMKDVQTLLETEYPQAKHITVRQRQDADVVGGIRIDLANEQLDMSVQSKLNIFKRLTAHERNQA